jgi:hypothetical protein
MPPRYRSPAKKGGASERYPRRVRLQVTLLVLWLGALVAAAPGAAANLEGCETRLLPYAGRPASGPTVIELVGPGDARLLYFGVAHTRDPTEAALRELEEAFRRFRPTRVFFEGHETGVAADRDETVRRFAEAGLVRMLAEGAGVPAASLEPEAQEEVDHLLELASPAEVELFYLLRESRRMRVQLGLRGARLDEAVEELLATRGLPGLEPSITGLSDLERAFWKHWPYPRRWQDVPADVLAPRADSDLFTHRLALALAGVRDTHMFRALATALLAGQRVFAVAGANHVHTQAPALECLSRGQDL